MLCGFASFSYAGENGNEGARYPWESADTGHEVTPPWSADGAERIWTGERELHITSAVAGVQAARNGKMGIIGVGAKDILGEADYVINSFEEMDLKKLCAIYSVSLPPLRHS